jgi:GAF domain-containing protein
MRQKRPKKFFCQYAIQGDAVYEVENALENLFLNNPLVTGSPDIRFYAGAPLKKGWIL